MHERTQADAQQIGKELSRRCEELQGDVVRVAERQARPIRGIHDATVGDAKLVEAFLPRLQLRSVGAAECDMVESGPQFVEGVRAGGLPVLVNAEDCSPKEPNNMVEGAGVLVEDWCSVEEPLIPGSTSIEIVHRHRNMGNSRKVRHVDPLLPSASPATYLYRLHS